MKWRGLCIKLINETRHCTCEKCQQVMALDGAPETQEERESNADCACTIHVFYNAADDLEAP